MLNVPVVMLVAALAVLVGVIAVAVGRAGELTFFQADYAPLKLDEIAATDVVLFRPPMALWGYSVQATDEALNRIAEALTERDIEITALRQQVANLETSSPTGRRRIFGTPRRNDRADVPGRPSSGRPAASRDERSSGPLPRVGPPPGASGPGTRSSGPLPRVGPPGPPGLGTREARTPGAGSDRTAQSAASGARDAERFGLGGTAPAGRPPPADTNQPPAPAKGEDER